MERSVPIGDGEIILRRSAARSGITGVVPALAIAASALWWSERKPISSPNEFRPLLLGFARSQGIPLAASAAPRPGSARRRAARALRRQAPMPADNVRAPHGHTQTEALRQQLDTACRVHNANGN